MMKLECKNVSSEYKKVFGATVSMNYKKINIYVEEKSLFKMTETVIECHNRHTSFLFRFIFDTFLFYIMHSIFISKYFFKFSFALQVPQNRIKLSQFKALFV